MKMKISEMKILDWWRGRNELERVLTLISIVCGLALVVLIFSLVSVTLNYKTEERRLTNQIKIKTQNYISKDGENICLYHGCIKAAGQILDKMDKSVEPCDNFYDFACGQYVKDTIIPDDKGIVSSFNVINNKLMEQLRAIITSPSKASEIEPFRVVKQLYFNCMYTSYNQTYETNAQSLFFRTSLGGWPSFDGDKWDEESWSWQQSVKNYYKHGYSTDYFFRFIVGTDLKNSTRTIITIDQPALGLNREYLIQGLEQPVVAAYHSYQVDMVVLYGVRRNISELDMKDVLEFEIELAKISLSVENRRNATEFYNPTSVKELQKKHSYNDWLKYFNDILPVESKITEDEVISIGVMSFFEDLGFLLNRTPKRTLANYAVWRVKGFSTNFANDRMRKRKLIYNTAVNGIREQQPHWKDCLISTSRWLPTIVSALYVRNHFNKETKAAALELVNSIKEEFVTTLKTLPWLDDKTKTAALHKIEKMIAYIGYPDELLDDEKLVEYYDELNFDELKNFAFRKLRKPVTKTDWITHSITTSVNAFYSTFENSIKIPAAILQGPFFSVDRPNYMNFGALGMLIGHEITHGFDDHGRQFDSEGNLVDWWGKDTNKDFLKRSRCILEQYENFTEPNVDLKLNGIRTLGENIADNGGIKHAYFAYKNFVNRNGVEKRLPGLNYTPDQLFWISAAQMWCSVYRPEEMRRKIITKDHSPGIFRVLGSMSNMKEFSNDFQCPKGSRMNPINKCEIW